MVNPGGVLTVAEGTARLDARVNEFSPAIDAESARWGDATGEPARGRAEWSNAVQDRRDCLTDRQSIVENQLRQDGLWPLSAPPVISPVSGAVPFGENATVSAAGQLGTVYVTTDGSDPRGVDGLASPSAQVYAGPITIASDLTITARVLNAGNWSPLTTTSYTLSTPAGPVRMALNEFNAVSGSNFLGGGLIGDTGNGSDDTFGRILGNGGDWIEFVVIEDQLDIRGWTVEVWNEVDGIQTRTSTLTFADDPALTGLLAGSLVTVSEDIPDDVSYAPASDGDWHINLQSNNLQEGAYVTSATQSNFSINNDDTQIAIFDASGLPVQLRTGEGTAPAASVSSSEVFKLEVAPTIDLTSSDPGYEDGTSSTFGLPNRFNGGVELQDNNLASLRVDFGDADCDGLLTVGDALVIAQYTVGIRVDSGGCPLGDPVSQLHVAAADVDESGVIDIGDALLVAQCSVGLFNSFCSG